MRLHLLLLLAFIAASAHAAPPLEAYGRLPSIEHANLSPDGSKVAFIQTTQDTRVLAIYDLAESRMISVTRMREQPVRSVDWADDTHLLLTTASATVPLLLEGVRTEWHLMQVFDLVTKKWTPLLKNVHTAMVTMDVVYGRPVIHRNGKETLLYVEGVAAGAFTHLALFSINLNTGLEELVRQGDKGTQQFLVDDAGTVVAEQDYFEKDRTWQIQLFRGNQAPQIVSGVAAIDTPDMLGLSPAGDEILFNVTEGNRFALRPLQVGTGKWGEDVALKEHLSHLLLKNGSNTMIGKAFVGDQVHYQFVDKGIQDGWDWVVGAFGYQHVTLVSASDDHSKMIVQVMGPKSGYAYYLADIKEHLTRQIGKVYGDVTQIAEVRAIRYPAADGLEIPAYLTLPPDRPAKMLPVIVFPHDGPERREVLEFDWWAQAMASQGYAVLQPNFRGSWIDKAWIEAGYGQWGRKMQTDLSDGLQYLAAQGIVDARRACIVGASYGGYAALAGVSIQTGIYRCAVAVAGISDPANMLRRVMRQEAYGHRIGQRYWERFLGVDNADDKALDAISPLKNANRITVPLLLIHGREDMTVPYDQSEDLAKAMKHAGKAVQFVILKNEDHYLSHSETRLQMLQASMEFLRANNPPD